MAKFAPKQEKKNRECAEILLYFWNLTHFSGGRKKNHAPCLVYEIGLICRGSVE